LGFSELLIDQFDSLEPNKKKEFLTNIHVSLQHVYRLLENLLSWSRVQLGTFDWTPETVDLKSIVDDSMLLLKTQAATKHIELHSEIAEALMAFADPNMIETVVRNLITNAVKFTPENGKVWLEAASLENCIQVSIKDTGIGIAEDQIERLFKTGVKSNRAGTNDETGTGLGLILCKEFVEKNGGRIWVESSVGKGSCFRFSVPRSEQAG
jgi:signal transduction histidine kinase